MDRSKEEICFEVELDKPSYASIAPEIVMTSSFFYDDMQSFINASHDELNEFMYTRGANPTTHYLELKLKALEEGERCKVFASGMGAISATLLTFLNNGDHVLILNTIYSTAQSYLMFMERYGVSFDIIETTDAFQIESHIQENTKLIYIESPSTQKFEIVDLKKVAEIAKKHKLKTVIDNTWATPLYQQPLTMGIDISIHSCSKYIGGHSDIVAGAVIGRSEDVLKIEKAGFMYLGATCSPMNAYLALRGLRTLPLRMERHHANVKDVIDFLVNDKRIDKVFHPYAQQQSLATKMLSGYGSLLAVTFVDKDTQKLAVFTNTLNKFLIGVSWGGYESMVLPVFKEDNVEAMRTRGLDITHTRLFIGLSGPQTLIQDLNEALDSAYGSESR